MQAPAFRPVYVPGEAKEQVKAVEKSAEKALESYSLTNAAKAVIAAVAAFVVLLIALIGVNTRILNAKGAELTMLEEKKAEQRACKPHRKSYQRRNHRRMGASQRLDEIKEIRYKIK